MMGILIYTYIQKLSNMEQILKAGDRVKVKAGQIMWSTENGETKIIDIMPQLTQDEGVIEYSYNERYGNGTTLNTDRYSIKFDKYGSISWFSHDNIILCNK